MAIDKTIKINIDADEVLKKLDQIEKDLAGVKKGVEGNTKQMDGLGKSANTTAQGMTTLAGGIGVVALALKALAISGIMRAFDLFFTVLQNNQTVLDKTNIAFETINISVKNIVNSLTNLELGMDSFIGFLKNIGNLVLSPINSILDGLGFIGKALKKLFEGEFKQASGLAIAGAKKIRDGMLIVPAAMEHVEDSVVSSFKTITGSANETAKSIVELRNQIILNEAEQRKIQLITLRDAELQRQIRDDVSKNIDDRIAANIKLGDILKKGLQDELALADEKLLLAKQELATDEKNVELKAQVANAEADILEIRERITGQTSEQLVNETALQDERIANLQELSDIGKSELERQINDIEVQADQKRTLARRTIKDAKLLQKTLVKIDKDAANQKKGIEITLANQKRDIVANSLGAVADLIGKETAAGKALAVAQALINTYSAAAAALAPPPVGAGPIFGPVAAIGAVATGMKSVNDILSTKLPGGESGGGGSTPSAPSPGTPPEIPEMQGIGGLLPDIAALQEQESAAVQAYVIENDISSSQALQEELEIQATL